jgi:hypothetical protein
VVNDKPNEGYGRSLVRPVRTRYVGLKPILMRDGATRAMGTNK